MWVQLCYAVTVYNDCIDNSDDGVDSDSIKYESDDDNNDVGNSDDDMLTMTMVIIQVDYDDYWWSLGFSEGSVVHLAYQILEGLAFLHSKGVTHRSLSLDNILLQTQVTPLSILYIYICVSLFLLLYLLR